MNELLTTTEASKYLGVSSSTVRDYVHKKRLEPEKVGNNNFFSKDSLEAFKAEKERRIRQSRKELGIHSQQKFNAEEMEIVQEFRMHKDDTGSIDVQIALLSMRIEKMFEDLKLYQKDQMMFKVVRIKMIQAIGERRKLLNVLKQTDTERHHKLIKKLNIKGASI